jgi:hypothetical protein
MTVGPTRFKRRVGKEQESDVQGRRGTGSHLLPHIKRPVGEDPVSCQEARRFVRHLGQFVAGTESEGAKVSSTREKANGKKRVRISWAHNRVSQTPENRVVCMGWIVRSSRIVSIGDPELTMTGVNKKKKYRRKCLTLESSRAEKTAALSVHRSW